MKHSRTAVAFLVFFVSALAASAQTYVFELDQHQSTVAFTLGDVLHTVHGTFQLKNGSVRFDNTSGVASGLLVVDAATGASGNGSRDRKMHKEILESQKFPDIMFAPQHIHGQVPQEGKAELTMDGTMTLHGQPHDITITVPVEVHNGLTTADMVFPVPYVKWGLKNPSTFILRVDDKVSINVHAVGHLVAANR
jgi:polyisoprenoid-binding protein YceI